MDSNSAFRIKLLDGEKVNRKITPHFLAFYNLYVLWIYVFVLGALFIYFHDYLLDMMESPAEAIAGLYRPSFELGFLSTIGLLQLAFSTITSYFNELVSFISDKEHILSLIWLLLLYVFSMLFSIMRIEWKWIVLLVGAGALSIAVTILLDLPEISAYYISMLLSVFGCVGVDLYRRAHSFYLTNYRIITELNFLGFKQNTLGYDKINNLVVEQSALGSLFNFGTVIPITASGLGMGEDSAAVTVGAAGKLGSGPYIAGAVTGGRTVGVPRTRSQYALFGVEDPQEIYNLIVSSMQEYSQAPYLKDMSENLRKMLDNQKNLGRKGV